MSFFNIVAATNEDTVVATYEPSKVRSDSYQSEAELEKEFIRLLCEQGYTYLPLHTEDELIANLRSQLEELNHYQFSDTEWRQFFSDVIANPNEHIPEKTRKIQEDNVQVLHRDDGSSKNITLIDKKNIHNNRLQVINQYEVKQADGARHDNRYDVTILVNGFPLVHVELKRRGVAIREAFNQINRYQRDSFWAGCGLYEYTQIFVISNGTNTKYYSNSTRYNAIKDAKHGKTKKEKSSNSFEFTSYWADANNRVLTDLIDFTRTFFAKHTILSVLTRYCIFTSEKMLMVMRPYQITATERILNRIEIANNYKKYGSIEGGGYIWHTTGSGKTLTSFKTARLASQLPYIDKVTHRLFESAEVFNLWITNGEIDFQFRNDLDTPVYIMSWMDGVTLHVQFYGKHPKEWDTINVYSQTTSEIPPLSTVKYVVDQNLKKGEKVLSTSGNWGYEASAWRDFVKDGEVIRTETLPSSYYGPSGTIYRIGPGTETSSPSPTPRRSRRARRARTARAARARCAAPRGTAARRSIGGARPLRLCPRSAPDVRAWCGRPRRAARPA